MSNFSVKKAISSNLEGLFYISENKGIYGYLCKDGIIRSAAYQKGSTRELLIKNLDSSYCESEAQALDVIAKYEKTGKYATHTKKKVGKAPPEFLYCRFKWKGGFDYLVKYKPIDDNSTGIYAVGYTFKQGETYCPWLHGGLFPFVNMHEFQALRQSDVTRMMKVKG